VATVIVDAEKVAPSVFLVVGAVEGRPAYKALPPSPGYENQGGSPLTQVCLANGHYHGAMFSWR